MRVDSEEGEEGRKSALARKKEEEDRRRRRERVRVRLREGEEIGVSGYGGEFGTTRSSG